jgi:hypothetical protein
MQGAEELRRPQWQAEYEAVGSSTDEYDSVCLGQRERETVNYCEACEARNDKLELADRGILPHPAPDHPMPCCSNLPRWTAVSYSSSLVASIPSLAVEHC